MGKLLYFLCFILSVFPADANENRRHIHVTRKGDKKSHRGDTVAKIWIEENKVFAGEPVEIIKIRKR